MGGGGAAAQVMAHHCVNCHAVVVAKAGAIRKTTSGKVQRRACRAAFVAGQYSQVGACSGNPNPSKACGG